MTAVLPIARARPLRGIGGWRGHLAALGLLAAAILLLFHADAADLVGVWLRSETFNHCLLIPPIIGWLVAQRLPQLRELSPAAWAPGLLIVAAGGFSWLLGYAGALALARHAGIVLMLQGAVVACLGPAVARGLAFPLFFALFLIPVGEQLVAPLQTVTARMSMALLALAGVPAHIEGIFITTPGGYFKVAEACSGVQFLIAMIAYGALVANLCFRSPLRRALFVFAATAVPILANGLRAFATIYVAELTSSDFAAGFDHIVFGWLFFGLVMALLTAAGWRFFDRGPSEPWFDPRALQPFRPASSRLAPVAAAALLIAALPLAWPAAGSSAQAAGTDFQLPAVPGWEQLQPSGRWEPRFAGADLVRRGRYRSAGGQEVELVVAVYLRQQEGRELVGFGQGEAPGWAWTANGAAPPGGRLDRIASFGRVREVATFYRVGGRLVGSAYAVKLATMKDRLLGGPGGAVAVLVSAEAPGEGVSPRPAIDAFLRALGPAEALADRAAGLPQR